MFRVYFENPKDVMCPQGCKVYLDTGSSLIAVPQPDFDQLIKRIRAYQVPGTNRYEV